MIGLLCRTPQKDSRHELMRRVAAGGGVFKGENGLKVHLPCANLNDIANQADDLLEVINAETTLFFSHKLYHCCIFQIVHCVFYNFFFLLLQLSFMIVSNL